MMIKCNGKQRVLQKTPTSFLSLRPARNLPRCDHFVPKTNTKLSVWYPADTDIAIENIMVHDRNTEVARRCVYQTSRCRPSSCAKISTIRSTRMPGSSRADRSMRSFKCAMGGSCIRAGKSCSKSRIVRTGASMKQSQLTTCW